MTQMTITIDDETALRIGSVAHSVGQTPEELAAAAVADAYAPAEAIDLTPEQWVEIERAIAEVDRGEFATSAEVAAAFAEFRK